ncbi:hypothetical protein QEG98_01480 [Myxococcus sp. MxC21-1]|uniref:imm11 family protein n=1 Tax=Myxococcus sp. MxC21-1 TaxID=3041439 RepID=UPI0029316558|nr:DUF1629 domain-containing protein [Myxococcus sp. MxC21-1]WNZ62545.1 hypothetical protein QEG98_01480 [Myxococcus sp. MxC21-1]
MDYFSLTRGPTVDRSLCMLEREPKGLRMFSHRLGEGYPMGDKYPPDAEWQMSSKYGGGKLASLIASHYVVVERALKEVFERTGVPMECLNFTLFDHKGQVASRDYFIINPLGTFDCLHLEKSEIKYSKEMPGEIIGIRKHVLDSNKLRSAPDFFRIKEDPYVYVLSHKLVDELQQLNPTNVYLTKLEQA